MKYVFIFIFLIFSFNTHASTKNKLKNKLKSTNNIYFKFIQKINKNIEKGECKISYPKKILCNYDDIYKKVLVSNGRSLVINSKKIKNYLNYRLKDTSLFLILDKDFLLKKIDEAKNFQKNKNTLFFEIKHDNTIITIFFDNKNYNLKGWTTLDVYQNKVETKLFEVETNIMIDNNIFKVQRYIN